MPILEFFRSLGKKKVSQRVADDPPGPGNEKGSRSRASKRQNSNRSLEDYGKMATIPDDMNQKSGMQHLSSAQQQLITKQRRDAKQKKSRMVKLKDDHGYNAPITQLAEDVRTNKEVRLHLEELRYHSGGVFSNVYRGKMVLPEKLEVAIKKTWPKDTVRSDEMIILAAMRRANPRNIIKLLYIFRNKAPVDGADCEAFVFGYMPENLEKTIQRGLSLIDIKIYSWQLFNGLYFLAANRIAHRDIKPINILVNPESGELQIGDFGSAKVITSRNRSSAYQVTRYYRPPEMLLGSAHYTHLIDVWSAGCVMGEMIKGRVLFRGSDTENQLQLIQAAFGAPNEEQCRLMKVKNVKLQNVAKLGILVSLRLTGPSAAKLTPALQAAIHILCRILVYVPEKRLCGKELLEDPFFADVMAPTCVRENGARPQLLAQLSETMNYQCFERSQRETHRTEQSHQQQPSLPQQQPLRISKMCPPPEKELASVQQPASAGSEVLAARQDTEDHSVAGVEAAALPPRQLLEPPPPPSRIVRK